MASEENKALFRSALEAIDKCAEQIRRSRAAQEAIPLFEPFAERTRTILRYLVESEDARVDQCSPEHVKRLVESLGRLEYQLNKGPRCNGGDITPFLPEAINLFRKVASEELFLFVDHLWAGRQDQIDLAHATFRRLTEQQGAQQERLAAAEARAAEEQRKLQEQLAATEARVAEQLASVQQQMSATEARVAEQHTATQAQMTAMEARLTEQIQALREELSARGAASTSGDVASKTAACTQQRDGAWERWREQWQGRVSSEMSVLCARLIADDPKVRKVSAAQLGHVGFSMDFDDVRALCEALRANTTVEELDLSIPEARDDLKGHATRAVATSGAQLIGELVLPVHPKLRVVSLENNLIGQGAMPAIAAGAAKSRSLRVLRLGGNMLGAAGVAALTPALVGESALEELDLTGELSIDDEAAGHIAEALKSTSACVKVLCLSRTGVREAGAAALAAGLRDNTSLRELVLDGCAIGDGGVEHLAAALEHNSSLQLLSLDNVSSSARGVNSVARMLRADASLRHLRLTQVWISSSEDAKCIKELADAIPASTALEAVHFTTRTNSSELTQLIDTWEPVASALLLSSGSKTAVSSVSASACTNTTQFFKNGSAGTLLGLRSLSLHCPPNPALCSGVGNLADLLCGCPNLTTLEITTPNINDRVGAPAPLQDLQTALASHPLESLTLSCGCLSGGVVVNLAGIVASNSSLRKLSIRGVPLRQIRMSDLGPLFSALQNNTSLKMFHFDRGSTDNSGSHYLSSICRSVSSLLVHNTTLTDLALRNFGLLGAEGSAQVAASLLTNSTLSTLDLTSGGYSGINCLVPVIRSNRTLCKLVLRGAHANVQCLWSAACGCGRADDLEIVL
ncbi:unnamed protein product [Pedinophyceae sp. YPF-701]|nr:unnamed protein product [Pedinophyceae sp. YPF-701]